MLESLNHEAASRHELTLMVRDQGTPSKRGLARVIVTVLDHNDHAPEFLAPHAADTPSGGGATYEGRVYSTATAGTAVLQVVAVDRDRGVNAEVRYAIVAGESSVGLCWSRTKKRN